VSVAAASLVATGPALAQEDFGRIVTTLRACAGIEDMVARVQCYDNNIYPREPGPREPGPREPGTSSPQRSQASSQASSHPNSAADPTSAPPAPPVVAAPAAGATPAAGFGREMVRQPAQAARPASDDT